MKTEKTKLQLIHTKDLKDRIIIILPVDMDANDLPNSEDIVHAIFGNSDKFEIVK